MTYFTYLPFVASAVGLLLACASLVRKKPTLAAWCFVAGMSALAFDALFTGLSQRATRAEEAVSWLTAALVAKSFQPAGWLAFSLVYSRGNYREFLARWKVPLLVLGAVPVAVALLFRGQLFQGVPVADAGTAWVRLGPATKVLNTVLLTGFVMVLVNLEQTFRSAVGTMRWRIKYVVLGMGVILGASIYVRSQAVLFPAYDLALGHVEAGALLIGCGFLVLAHLRTSFAEADVYPSLSVLRSSFTVLVVGAYLFTVGVVAELVRRFGGSEIFQFQTLVVLLGAAGLAVLLLSDRLRQTMHLFVARHFRKAQHDSVQIWSLFSRELSRVRDEASLAATSARLVAETLDVLSVSVWLFDAGHERLVLAASTAPRAESAPGRAAQGVMPSTVAAALRGRSQPFDLDDETEPWAEDMRQRNPSGFANGGHRLCVPLRAGDVRAGVLILADRVNGLPYSPEELELLRCIAKQATATLLTLRLSQEVAQAKELEAFRTMSTFFVHDLKNAAASLNLMLKNLPVHFNDPAFREDALRGVGNTARRIDGMIARLSALRQRPSFNAVPTDLNEVVRRGLDSVDGLSHMTLTKELNPLPAVPVDREQMQSVVTNLVLNARDALGDSGTIRVRTEHQAGRVVLSVSDDGCGMSETFVKESLFRPFQSTKKDGLGIGMFQCRLIVEAHGGSIQVESEKGVGTTFRVSLPVQRES